MDVRRPGRMCEDLGIDVEDPVVLVLAWKAQAKKSYQPGPRPQGHEGKGRGHRRHNAGKYGSPFDEIPPADSSRLFRIGAAWTGGWRM